MRKISLGSDDNASLQREEDANKSDFVSLLGAEDSEAEAFLLASNTIELPQKGAVVFPLKSNKMLGLVGLLIVEKQPGDSLSVPETSCLLSVASTLAIACTLDQVCF